MEAPNFYQEPEPEPQIQLLREVSADGSTIYRFFTDGEDSHLTMTREEVPRDQDLFTYYLRYEDWNYGEADVHHGQEATEIEWQGIAEGMDDLAQIEARKFMEGSLGFLLKAIEVDFPGSPVTDAEGNPILH